MSLNTQGETTLLSGQKHTMQFGDAREQYQKNSNWWVVYATFDLPDFVPSPTWISQRTKLDVSEVVEALDGLTTLGFLNKENGAFYPVKGKDFVNFNWPDKSKAQIIDEHAIVSQQMLNQLSEEVRIAFDHRCFAANKEIVVELYKDILNSFEKAFQKAQANPCSNDGIFKMTFTAVDVAPTQGSQGRGN